MGKDREPGASPTTSAEMIEELRQRIAAAEAGQTVVGQLVDTGDTQNPTTSAEMIEELRQRIAAAEAQ